MVTKKPRTNRSPDGERSERKQRNENGWVFEQLDDEEGPDDRGDEDEGLKSGHSIDL
jgi:hypothetical protein